MNPITWLILNYFSPLPSKMAGAMGIQKKKIKQMAREYLDIEETDMATCPPESELPGPQAFVVPEEDSAGQRCPYLSGR